MSNEKLLENHVRALYRFLGHNGAYSRVGSFDYGTKKFDNKVLFGEEAVINYAKEWNGIRNIFIGRAPRDNGGAPVSVSVVSFDIDPIRPKGEASTDEQHKNALSAASRILSLYPGGYIASSGNGALLLYHLPAPVTGFDVHYGKEAVFIKELQKAVDTLNVKIDSTNYSEAVIKAIGTFSTKGAPECRRCSRFIDFPILPFRNAHKLVHRLTDIEPAQSVSANSVDLRALSTSYNGDRSVADWHMVNYLKKSGLGPSDALKALQANPIGRQTDEKDQARLIGKIYGAAALPEGLDVRKVSYFDQIFRPDSTDGETITTGFSSLDTALGKLPRGEITTFAARTGYGKSTFGCTVAESLRRRGRRVLYFSTEMSEEYIMHKLVAIAKDVPLEQLVQRKDLSRFKDRIKEYEGELLQHPIAICDEFQPTIEYVQTEIIKHKPDVVILDHFTHIETHWEKQAQYLNKLKEIVQNENIPLILLNELGEPPRGKDGTEVQSLRGDVRGSQQILYISAIFGFFSNPFEVKTQYQPVQVHIAKNRYGQSNQVVELTLDKVVSKFLEGKNNEPA